MEYKFDLDSMMKCYKKLKQRDEDENKKIANALTLICAETPMLYYPYDAYVNGDLFIRKTWNDDLALCYQDDVGGQLVVDIETGTLFTDKKDIKNYMTSEYVEFLYYDGEVE